MPPLELTLVVAATRDMGIGRAGTLPWTGLKKEMAYFARVTKRLPPGAPPKAVNAVIMGRKTWESIPPRFRPLKGRLNVVITRSLADAAALLPQPPASSAGAGAGAASQGEEARTEGPIRAESLQAALRYLETRRKEGALGYIFVTGGAGVYDAALALPEAKRVLLTRVDSDFECDTFFPLKLGSDSEAEGAWKRTSREDHEKWVGEDVPEGVQTESGTEYEFQMWQRRAG